MRLLVLLACVFALVASQAPPHPGFHNFQINSPEQAVDALRNTIPNPRDLDAVRSISIPPHSNYFIFFYIRTTDYKFFDLDIIWGVMFVSGEMGSARHIASDRAQHRASAAVRSCRRRRYAHHRHANAH
jgi:hypothetical protein